MTIKIVKDGPMTIKIVKDGPMTIKIVRDGPMTIKIAHAHLHYLHNIPANIYKYLGGVADTKSLKLSLLMMYFFILCRMA
jgi:hypothetical protein